MPARAVAFVVLLCAPAALLCATTLNFEGLPDGTFLDNQYSGLTFSNALILTAGISLNELDFPPHSGVNVVTDFSGPISVVFSTRILSVSAYFTYTVPITMAAFDASSHEIGSARSAFSSNAALSGDPGSAPNELLRLNSTVPIHTLTITGDPSGGSFVMDDLTYSTSGSVVPEPGTSGPTVVSLLFLAVFTLARSGRLTFSQPPTGQGGAR